MSQSAKQYLERALKEYVPAALIDEIANHIETRDQQMTKMHSALKDTVAELNIMRAAHELACGQREALALDYMVTLKDQTEHVQALAKKVAARPHFISVRYNDREDED